MTGSYWAGVLTLPVLALVGWALLMLGSVITEHVKAWKPTYLADLPRRADYAAAMVAARRVAVVTAFGWRFTWWQIGTRDDDRRHVWAKARDGITNALGTDVAEPPYPASFAPSDSPDWTDPR